MEELVSPELLLMASLVLTGFLLFLSVSVFMCFAKQLLFDAAL